MFGSYAGPEVADVELDAVIRLAGAQNYAFSGSCVLHRVLDQIRKYLVDSLAVGVDWSLDDFFDSVGRVAHGGSVVDPALVQELVSARRRDDPLAALSPRELEVLALMAEGRSNLGIAQELWVAEGTVEKHVRSILGKLDLSEESTDHRRVLAVVTFLESR